MKILLKRDDIDPNRSDEHDKTPLYHAVQNEHEGIVKILLERDDVSPNNPDNKGQTPLW